MKKRTPPYALATVLVVGVSILITFGVISARQNQPQDAAHSQTQSPDAVGDSRQAPSKEEIAQTIKSRSGSVGTPAPPPNMPNKPNLPPGLPPGMQQPTIYTKQPKAPKPKPDQATTSSQWYLEESRND